MPSPKKLQEDLALLNLHISLLHEPKTATTAPAPLFEVRLLPIHFLNPSQVDEIIALTESHLIANSRAIERALADSLPL